ncbi:winged helix-turn-helix domain-containing protein [Helicobacter kayseriensis]|uniref:winged helix-turn-helix domain-containing protein n=1 Tax=Helicobacter kayseriensis TaxID=2905877 RepID=UPI001E304572|nr:LysR family transcriptional regulator [Helicobacter kayseriensis]MCE3047749.1 LysR family transcriptional regulator [Helicobacter kayseriensis]MCE3049100.1 LysR family transcriptional regulator [Helicobacter kayseriensis]
MDEFLIHSRIWIKKGGRSYLGRGRVELLRHIKKEGSLLKASKKMYMSYKAAWDSLHQIREIGGEELVVSSSGGRGGGGTKLTQEGERAIEVFEHLERLKEKFWGNFGGCQSLDEMMQKIQKWEKIIEENQEKENS